MPRVTGQPAPRPSWDEWALALADSVATRADCSRRKVGAVALAPDHRVLGTGYNGLPSGVPGCASQGACPRGRLGYDKIAAGSPYVDSEGTCHALHAEENCALYLAGDDRRGATLYVTDAPCPNCTRLLAGSGFARVVWRDDDEGGIWERNLTDPAAEPHRINA